jgi:ribosome-binding factor A
MLPYKRSQRVAHQLRKEISDVITNRVKDPRLGFLTVTEVDVSDDLKLARVYISIMKEEERKASMEVLGAARKFIRSELGKRLRMKAIPSLEFKLDNTLEYGDRIDKLLKEVRQGH